MHVPKHVGLEELLSLASGVLARLDVDKRLAQPADELVARERFRLQVAEAKSSVTDCHFCGILCGHDSPRSCVPKAYLRSAALPWPGASP